MSFKLAKLLPSNIKKINADFFATRIEKIQEILQDNMLLA